MKNKRLYRYDGIYSFSQVPIGSVFTFYPSFNIGDEKDYQLKLNDNECIELAFMEIVYDVRASQGVSLSS